jgi:hypothetical protein
MREPLLHSHVTDTLPDGHELAHVTVYCQVCGAMLHASNNECMQAWVETGKGPYCVKCFVSVSGVVTDGVIVEEWGLPDLAV